MDQEILDLFNNFDAELDGYKKKALNTRFHRFFSTRGYSNHQLLPTNDGSIVIGPPGSQFSPNNTYLVKYPRNGYYIGPLKGQLRHGVGYRAYPDQELVYVGDYQDNMKQGKGKLWSRSEKRWVFDGNWANDMKNGFGEMWKKGVTYKGNWANDKLDGIGRMDWPSGQSYEGSFAADIRNGEGTMIYPTGDTYVGTWRNGRPNGKGVYQWKSGEVYEGEWTDGVMNGSGAIDYGIPVKGLGSVNMGSVARLNYNVQRPEEWQSSLSKSSQFIKSYRETIVPDSVKKSLRPEVTSSIGVAGYDGKAPPANLNFSYEPSARGLQATTVESTYKAPIPSIQLQSNNSPQFGSNWNAQTSDKTYGIQTNDGKAYGVTTGSTTYGVSTGEKSYGITTGDKTYGVSTGNYGLSTGEKAVAVSGSNYGVSTGANYNSSVDNKNFGVSGANYNISTENKNYGATGAYNVTNDNKNYGVSGGNYSLASGLGGASYGNTAYNATGSKYVPAHDDYDKSTFANKSQRVIAEPPVLWGGFSSQKVVTEQPAAWSSNNVKIAEPEVGYSNTGVKVTNDAVKADYGYSNDAHKVTFGQSADGNLKISKNMLNDDGAYFSSQQPRVTGTITTENTTWGVGDNTGKVGTTTTKNYGPIEVKTVQYN